MLHVAVSHKKRVLLRWQGASMGQAVSPPAAATPSLSTPPAVAPSAENAAALPPTSQQLASDPAPQQDARGRGSPLFEEFSDSEEFMDQQAAPSPPHQQQQQQQQKQPQQHHAATHSAITGQLEPVSPGKVGVGGVA